MQQCIKRGLLQMKAAKHPLTHFFYTKNLMSMSSKKKFVKGLLIAKVISLFYRAADFLV